MVPIDGIDSNALLEWTIGRCLCASACLSGCAVMQAGGQLLLAVLIVLDLSCQ